jgi:hypothetical protein
MGVSLSHLLWGFRDLRLFGVDRHCTKLEIQNAVQIVISLDCTEREPDARIQLREPRAQQQEPRVHQHLPPPAGSLQSSHHLQNFNIHDPSEAINSSRPEPRIRANRQAA